MAKTLEEKHKHLYKSSPEKTQLALDMIRQARMAMLTYFKFYSSLALKMQLIPAPIGTCATDGKNFIFDPEFIVGASPEFLDFKKSAIEEAYSAGKITEDQKKENLDGLTKWFSRKTTKEVVFIILHELRHMINATLQRAQGLDHKLVNKASDYNINNRLKYELLSRGYITDMLKDVPISKYLLLEDKYWDKDNGEYTEWTTEAIYLDLMQKGEGGGGVSESFDIHEEFSEEQVERIKENIIQGASGAGAGDTPSDVESAVKEWTEPKIHWANLFDRRLKTNIISDYNYAKPASRSFVITDILRNEGFIGEDDFYIAPSYEYEETIDAVLAFDTSGSISNEVKQQVLSEAVGIINQFQQATLHLISWDTQVAGYDKYEHVTQEDVKGFKFKGGGGTAPDCIPEFLEENKINASSVVIFTDMCFNTDYEKFKKLKNVIWVAFDSNAKAKVGTTIKYIA